MTAKDLDAFTRAYLECALWTTDPSPGSGGYQADLSLISPDDLEKAIADCAKFQADNAEILDRYDDRARAGHDLWLTRNGHGTGYWDTYKEEPYTTEDGDDLTDAAHALGETEIYVDAWEDIDNAQTDDDGSFDDEV